MNNGYLKGKHNADNNFRKCKHTLPRMLYLQF